MMDLLTMRLYEMGWEIVELKKQIAQLEIKLIALESDADGPNPHRGSPKASAHPHSQPDEVRGANRV